MLKYGIVERNNIKYVEAFPNGNLIASEADALDWVAACGENSTNRLMLNAGNFPDSFFDLSTGLAGAVLLKFVNYYLIVAAVLSPELVNQGKFQEMALETNRGQ